jgi:hypothetical protein
VADAIAHKEQITKHLLSILKEADENPEPFGEEEYCGHLFALFLLAKFREERAWPLVVAMVSGPGGPEDIPGGVVTEGLSAVMASVCGDDLPGLKALIDNAGINEWVIGRVLWGSRFRSAALHAIVRSVGAGRLDRDEAMRCCAAFSTRLSGIPTTCGMCWERVVWIFARRRCSTRLITLLKNRGEIRAKDRTQRSMSLWQRKEVQGVLRGLIKRVVAPRGTAESPYRAIPAARCNSGPENPSPVHAVS